MRTKLFNFSAAQFNGISPVAFYSSALDNNHIDNCNSQFAVGFRLILTSFYKGTIKPPWLLLIENDPSLPTRSFPSSSTAKSRAHHYQVFSDCLLWVKTYQTLGVNPSFRLNLLLRTWPPCQWVPLWLWAIYPSRSKSICADFTHSQHPGPGERPGHPHVPSLVSGKHVYQPPKKAPNTLSFV